MADWAEAALGCLRAAQPCALVSVLACAGSTPRDPGTRMLVTPTACVGSIGGGNLEFQLIRQARRALDQPPGSWRIQDYALGPLLSQCCGGRVRLLVEHLDADQAGWIAALADPGADWLETQFFEGRLRRRWLANAGPPPLTPGDPLPGCGDRIIERVGHTLQPLMMIGAGHVGQALAAVLDGLPFRLEWYDTRPDYQSAGATVAEIAVIAENLVDYQGFVLILTHDHGLDYLLVGAALAGPARFVGLIGSNSKRARFMSRLTKDGLSATDLQRLCCPIGLPGLVGKQPKVIAVAVAAQLLLLAQEKGSKADDRG